MAPLAALILFILAALGVSLGPFGQLDLVAWGLACIALAMLIGNWPIGIIRRP